MSTNIEPAVLPGPAPKPVIGWRGSLLALWRDPLMYLQRLHADYGPVVALSQASPPVVSIFAPDIAQQMFSSPHDFRPLLSLPVDRLPVNREYAEQIFRLTIRFVEQALDRWAVGAAIDVAAFMRRMAVQTFFAVSFGVELLGEDADRLSNIIQPWVQDQARPALLFPFDRVHNLARSKQKARAAVQRILQPLAASSTAFTDECERCLPGIALLHEWCALTGAWAVLLLSQHVGVLDDLRAEVHGLLRGTAPTTEHLQKLPLLDGVVRESMRLLPPVAISVHTASGANMLDRYRIPENTRILYSPALLQRMGDFYYAPDRFRPQRWHHIDPGPLAFLPLGADPYAEVALPLVLLHVKLILAMLVQHYQLVPIPGITVNRRRSFLLAPRRDLSMIIAPTDRAAPKREIHGNIRDILYLP